MKKKIPLRYFEELINSGHCVARNEKTGEVIAFQVGKKYTISNDKDDRTAKVTCTQNYPCHIALSLPEKFI